MVEQQLFYKRHIFGRHATRVFPVVRSITLMGDLEFVETIDGISIKQRKREREKKRAGGHEYDLNYVFSKANYEGHVSFRYSPDHCTSGKNTLAPLDEPHERE